MGADREAACPHRGPGSVRWVLPTLSRVDFGLPGCWVAAGIPRWFRAAEACELFPQHTWALWSYFADSATLLSHWHSRPSRLCHFLPLETALGCPTHRNCYLCQGVTLVLNIAAPWQLLWRLSFFSFPWTPGRLWGTFSTMWGLGHPDNHHGLSLLFPFPRSVHTYVPGHTLRLCPQRLVTIPSFYLRFLFFCHPPTCGVWCWGSCGGEVKTSLLLLFLYHPHLLALERLLTASMPFPPS